MFYLRLIRDGFQSNYTLGPAYSLHKRGDGFDFSNYDDNVDILIECGNDLFKIDGGIDNAYIMTESGRTFAKIK